MALSTRAHAVLGRAFMTRLDELARDAFELVDARSLQESTQALIWRLASDPLRANRAYAALWGDALALWHNLWEAQRTHRLTPLVGPAPGDRRFRHDAWKEDLGFAYLQQSYLLWSRWLERLVDETDGLDPRTQRRLRFFTRQYLSAAAPTNFVATNPEVLERARETQGQSLVDGLRRFLDDLERGGGHLDMRLTDERAFAPGHNLAVSPGQVVFRNELIELIQYAPTTAEVHHRPLLVVPPWINKFYVLDLQPKNSLVKHLVDQGFTVFLISWVNPGAELAGKRFEDYLRDGLLAALGAIEATLGVREVGLMGFCIGGILVATALAHLAALGDDRVTSASFLATLFDFADVGEIGLFVDEARVAAMERHTAGTGFLAGRHMAGMFSMLRENDLVWSFFVNNYLLGRDPPPFDLLYWNGDATRLPAAMLSDYLRSFYLGNALARPNTLTVLGTPVDTRRVRVPSYALATKEDHITPWRSCFAVTRQFAGPVRFVLGASGHVAGIVNPPGRGKYGHWRQDGSADDADAWLAGATYVPGSWWTDWTAWLARHAGPTVPARDPAEGRLPPLCVAPGTYVAVRATG